MPGQGFPYAVFRARNVILVVRCPRLSAARVTTNPDATSRADISASVYRVSPICDRNRL